MKPGKLYLRIFLSFLIFLIITEIAILAVFMFGFGRHYQERYNQYNDSKLVMARELIEAAVIKQKEVSPAVNSDLVELIPRLGKVFQSMIWLTDNEEKILLKSFKGRIPRHYIEEYQERLAKAETRHYFGKYQEHWKVYLVDNISVGDRKIANLHILFKDRNPQHPGWGFAIGLVAIGLIIVVMIIPVSRQITKPIKSLTESAQRIENGDLSHRATIKRKDEIGELGKAFNAMASKVESMILSGKELTAQISHELRSPLARIQLAVELMKDKQRRGVVDQPNLHLDDIQDDVEELDRLIGRILELSKLDIGENSSYSESIFPDQQIEMVIKRFKPVLNSKSIRFTSQLTADSEIRGNREAFTTAISNLLDNACKFTPENGSISITSESRNQALTINVSNTCPQLTTDDLPRIFDPFFRTDSENKNGAGLGLAITKKIIEKHQGTVKATNTVDGLSIQIIIPI